MEEVLGLYSLPYDEEIPLVCMDEVPKQLIADVRNPLPAQAEQPLRVDYEYQRNGVANLFIFFEPFRVQRHVKVTNTRTRLDWSDAMCQARSKLVLPQFM